MRKAAWFLVLALLASLGHAELQYVTVTAFGQGVTKADAVKSAQIQAIGQVSGELIDARMSVNKTSKEVKGEGATRSREIASSTDSLIRGAIKSTRVIRVEMTAAGLYEAEIEAEVVRVAQSTQLNRRRVAVLLSDSQKYDRVSSSVRTATESGLVASRKMAVLDRQESAAFESEVVLMLSDRVPVEERLKMMNLPTADLLAVVTIEGWRESRNGFNQPITEIDTRISVIDVASRQLKFAKSIRTLYPGEQAAAQSQIGKLAGDRIARAILDFAYPIVVISESDGVAVVSAGSAQLKVGQEVTIYRLGTALKDPYTGERIGQQEIEAGNGVVIGVEAATARVKTAGFAWKKGTDYVVKLSGSKSAPAAGGGKTVSESDW